MAVPPVCRQYCRELHQVEHGVVNAMLIQPHPAAQLRKLSGEAEWEDSLQVRKDKEHFIFTVQSTGASVGDDAS